VSQSVLTFVSFCLSYAYTALNFVDALFSLGELIILKRLNLILYQKFVFAASHTEFIKQFATALVLI
jgi:hypothetical protein